MKNPSQAVLIRSPKSRRKGRISARAKVLWAVYVSRGRQREWTSSWATAWKVPWKNTLQWAGSLKGMILREINQVGPDSRWNWLGEINQVLLVPLENSLTMAQIPPPPYPPPTHTPSQATRWGWRGRTQLARETWGSDSWPGLWHNHEEGNVLSGLLNVVRVCCLDSTEDGYSAHSPLVHPNLVWAGQCWSHAY